MSHRLSRAANNELARGWTWCGAGYGQWGSITWHGEIPFGTLAANLSGGYLIGVTVAFFAGHPSIALEWRLFAITAFLGGLTTFSTFSAEVMVLLQRGGHLWALGHSAIHLIGSIACCIAGYATYRALA